MFSWKFIEKMIAKLPDGDDKDDNKGDKLLHCSFCGKSQHEIRLLISGPAAYICDECVELCNEIMREKLEQESDQLLTGDW